MVRSPLGPFASPPTTDGSDMTRMSSPRFAPTRRTLILSAGALAAALPAGRLAAQDALDLRWEDLMPGEGNASALMGIVDHGQLATGFEQPQATGVVTEFDGRTVRLPGFVVPLDYSGQGVTTFILAPYVGACVHVPPPPANQLVLVTTERPYEDAQLFDPVWVTGLFQTASTSTDLATIGYTLTAERIEPYTS